jgi:hypothetical protein
MELGPVKGFAFTTICSQGVGGVTAMDWEVFADENQRPGKDMPTMD